MKKSHTPTDINQKQGQELTKKLYRSISEQAKRLDDARSFARNITDLFTPNLIIQRKKFSEYCERLIFSDANLYGKKGEELLWRKCFYDVVSTAKKLKKKDYHLSEILHIEAHINAGTGFYHHMLMKLQQEFNLDLNGVIDFEMSCRSSEIKFEWVEWAKQSIHQCLIYLGDLNRYKLEIYPNWGSSLAIRYYLQAISYKPDYGMPHNQMGTLEINQNHYLEAVYHYMCCLSCKFPFEGTINNLHSVFEKNSKFIEQLPPDDTNTECVVELECSENIKRFLARFLLLIDIWYFNKKVTRVYNLCHQIYKNFEHCLRYRKSPTSESGDTTLDTESIETDSAISHLSNAKIFKIVLICLLCISKLRLINSQQLSTAIAFTLAIYSQLVQNLTNHIEESVLNYPSKSECKGTGILRDLMVSGKKRFRSKLRRKKVVKIEESDEESEGSSDGKDDYSSSDDSFISDGENVLAVSSDEELDIIKVSDESNCGTPKQHLNGLPNGMKQLDSSEKTKENIIKIIQSIDTSDMLEIITEESSLQSIKILNDWLRHEPDVLKSCGTNTRSVFRQITYLLNLINVNVCNPKMLGINMKIFEIINKESKIPLTEDVILKGVEMLKESQSTLDWDYINKRGLNVKEETIVRIVKLLSFGKYLATLEETGVSYNEDSNIFECMVDESNQIDKLPANFMEELERNEDLDSATTLPGNSSPRNPIDPKTQTNGPLNKMKHMGQLWLAAEVRALEGRVSGNGATLSPYLVVDAEALVRHSYAVKHLVRSRKFVILVPAAVVSVLDDLKRERIEARDVIRWLESQFHRGNRFFRAQRPQERTPIPFIKYPKKKDKEMHIYIQIIECCYFLADQQKGASNVVTLLIGNQNVLSNGENKEFSYVGLAQSVGIAIEPITAFYSKWKKSKGKR